MNYAVAQRMRLIDFLLTEYGWIKRSALVNYYGISVPQASEDFRVYMAARPLNMKYSLTRKRYEKTDDFVEFMP